MVRFDIEERRIVSRRMKIPASMAAQLRREADVEFVVEGLVCERCGCTDLEACEFGCTWVSTDPALCSACAIEEGT